MLLRSFAVGAGPYPTSREKVVSMSKKKFPKIIEVKSSIELLAYGSVEECIQGEEDETEVAQYELVSVRKFRNVATEVGK